MTAFLDALVGLAVVVFLCFLYTRSRLSYPPGPPSGWLRDLKLPAVEYWRTFEQWGRRYGSIVYYRSRGDHVIVLNTAKAAWDLLERRGGIYSSRPRSIVGQEILSGNMRALGMQYGERWRKFRKMQRASLGPQVAPAYEHFVQLEISVLLKDLLEGSHGHAKHFLRFATSCLLFVSYGRRIKDLNDPLVIENQEAVKVFLSTQVPGRYLVESWPALMKLPKSLQWFRWDMDKMKERDSELYLRSLREVGEKMKQDSAHFCLSSELLRSEGVNGLDELEMAYLAAMPFSAGVGTIVAVLEVFLLASLHYPEVAAKAQAELKAHADGQTPGYDDKDAVPYFRAFIKEVMRWRVISPTALAHCSTEYDNYDGYDIPKGSIVWANLYAIFRDPDLFIDSEEFRPERFLGNENPRLKEFNLPFGFGRRICPGQFVAERILFMVMLRILLDFEILPDADTDGKLVLPDPDAFHGTIVRQPLPFKCYLFPRSSDIKSRIVEDVEENSLKLANFE